jgi:hypothetical protein
LLQSSLDLDLLRSSFDLRKSISVESSNYLISFHIIVILFISLLVVVYTLSRRPCMHASVRFQKLTEMKKITGRPHRPPNNDNIKI